MIIVGVLAVYALEAQKPTTPPVPPVDWPNQWTLWTSTEEYETTRFMYCCQGRSLDWVAQVAAEEVQEIYDEGEEAKEYYQQAATAHDWNCGGLNCP